jgi:hypothetical protein
MMSLDRVTRLDHARHGSTITGIFRELPDGESWVLDAITRSEDGTLRIFTDVALLHDAGVANLLIRLEKPVPVAFLQSLLEAIHGGLHKSGTEFTHYQFNGVS